MRKFDDTYIQIAALDADDKMAKAFLRSRVAKLQDAVAFLMDDCDPEKEGESNFARYAYYHEEDRTIIGVVAMSVEEIINWTEAVRS